MNIREGWKPDGGRRRNGGSVHDSPVAKGGRLNAVALPGNRRLFSGHARYNLNPVSIGYCLELLEKLFYNIRYFC